MSGGKRREWDVEGRRLRRRGIREEGRVLPSQF